MNLPTPRPICLKCAKRESVPRNASTPDVAPAPCSYCGVETRGREACAARRVCGVLTCEVCGELVTTGPPADSEAVAAYELGRAEPSHTKGIAHLKSCQGACLSVSFVPVVAGF